MSACVTHPTPYPDINAVLHRLLSSVQTILRNELGAVALIYQPKRSREKVF